MHCLPLARRRNLAFAPQRTCETFWRWLGGVDLQVGEMCPCRPPARGEDDSSEHGGESFDAELL
jgi:hypothetical protein